MANGEHRACVDAYDGLIQAIGEYGLSVVDTTDPEIFAEAAAVVPGNPLSGGVVRTCFPNSPLAERWFCARDQAGRWIATQAARLDPIEETTVGDFVEGVIARRYGPATRVASARFQGNTGMGSPIEGRMAYMYRMSIVPDVGAQRYRDRRLSGLLARAFMLSLCRHWDPALVFGMISPGLIASGFADRCGFPHVIYPKATGDFDTLSLALRADVCDLARLSA